MSDIRIQKTGEPDIVEASDGTNGQFSLHVRQEMPARRGPIDRTEPAGFQIGRHLVQGQDVAVNFCHGRACAEDEFGLPSFADSPTVGDAGPSVPATGTPAHRQAVSESKRPNAPDCLFAAATARAPRSTPR
jgi:hypothetical protein